MITEYNFYCFFLFKDFTVWDVWSNFEVFQPAPIALFESVFDFHSSFYAFAQIVFIKWEVVFVQIVVIVAIDLKVERRRI